METQVKHNKKLELRPRKGMVVVFVVDDDLSYLYPLGFYLQKNTTHSIYCYPTGEECIKNIYKGPDVVILDINLTVENKHTMNGMDVLKRIKAILPKTKVIMLSGRETMAGVNQSMKLGAYMYIVKDLEALSKLKGLLEKIAEDKSKET